MRPDEPPPPFVGAARWLGSPRTWTEALNLLRALVQVRGRGHSRRIPPSWAVGMVGALRVLVA
eukprot:883188-Alexandrium_andersonii.AAC.1